jgi:hypothetical protein
MTHRFLLHSLNHNILVVDISELWSASENKPRTGNTEMAPTLRFGSWEDAERYFRVKGADDETIASASKGLAKSSVAVMTIV